jgi:hypothetical protein
MALVGDTRLGRRILVRSGISVVVSVSDQDDFVRKRATLLREGRFGLTVYQPTAWSAVTSPAEQSSNANEPAGNYPKCVGGIPVGRFAEVASRGSPEAVVALDERCSPRPE